MIVNKYFRQELAQLGIHLDAEILVKRFTGLTTKKVLAEIENSFSVPLSSEQMDAIQKTILQGLAKELQAVEGIASFLTSLLEEGRFECAVASSGPLRKFINL